jgi:hypothetical protein
VSHNHSHPHPRSDRPGKAPEIDLSIPDNELTPLQRSRREFFRRIGLLGAGLSLAGLGLPGWSQSARAEESREESPSSLLWLAGDHHIHTQYSADARYRVSDHVAHAAQYGVDWMVITDHGRAAHEKVGIDRTLTDVARARIAFPKMLVYQGLEWNIPGAEHGTVFVPPGPNEKAILHYFEKNFDGVVLDQDGVLLGATRNDAVHEAKAVAAIRWLDQQIATGQTAAGLFLANHPSRRGLDSPHEFRGWIDASPRVTVGMEGAPGHQAAGIAKAAMGPQVARGFYDFAPTPDSHPGYPLESYRTFGGFDWITARVGGLWDSLLAEGRRFWITANSDSHAVYKDTLVRGGNPPGTGADYDNPLSPFYGDYGAPRDTGVAQAGNGDFWPGYYSRTWVGVTAPSYEAVMQAIGAGRMWVCHGDLIRGLDVRVSASDSDSEGDSHATLGGTLLVDKGDEVQLRIKISPSTAPNFIGDRPVLRRVDLISGPITGVNPDRDSFAAPATQVVASWDIKETPREIVLKHRFAAVRQPFYLRLRGTDGNFSAPGSIEPRLDPVPMDPWTDLWFYSNPVFVEVAP